MKRILFVLTICLFSNLFSEVIDTLPPVVVDFKVNGKSFLDGVPEVAPSVLAEFKLSISDSGSGLESVCSFIDFDEDGNYSENDSLICNYTNLSGLKELTSCDTVDLFFIIPDTYNIIVEVIDTSGNVNSNKNFLFTIIEGGSPSVPVIVAIDESILGTGEIQMTLFAFTGLCYPSGYKYWPGYVKYEYKIDDNWIEIDRVYSEESVQGAENNFTVWPFKFIYNEELEFLDKEVRASFMLTYYNSDTLKISGPLIIPQQILENKIKPMSDGIIEIKSNNQIASPYNIVLSMTKSDTVLQFDAISTEKVNGLFRGTLPIDPCDILVDESGTVTFWTFSSYNINQPTFEFDLNASVLDINKIYQDQDNVVSSFDNIISVEIESGSMTEDALVYFEPDFVAFYDGKPGMDGFRIHTNYSGDKAIVEFLIKHGQNMAVIQNPVIEFCIKDYQNIYSKVFNGNSPNDTIALIGLNDSTVSFRGEFRDELIYYARVLDEQIYYTPPIANFVLVNDNDINGFIPHTVQFCNKSTPARGQGSGECFIRWDFDENHWFEYSIFDTAENVNWEDSYSGLISGTNGSPSFTFLEPDTYTVTLTITDTKGGGQDSYSKTIIVEPVDLYLNSVEIAQLYTNHEGKSYTNSTPEIEIEVGYPEENEAALKVHAYLNGHHVLFQSVPQDGFEWTGFSDGSATFQILNESDGSLNRYLKSDEVNEIYVVVYNERAGLEVTSEVMEFWIDATPPNITLEDDDEDWILGLLPIKNSGCYHAPDENNNVTIDVSDPESFISIDGSKLIIKDKAVQDSFVIHFSEMEFLGQNQNGFKLQKNLNFSNILVNLGWTEGNSSISNDFLFKVITLNKLGIETKIEQEFSFDLILPKIRLADDEIWNQIIQDSVAFDNDNDGKVNEDPIDGINNDGDWDDVNGNGRRDYYFNEWCEYAYDYKGEVTDSICHKEAVLEQEFIDEDPVDFIYCGYSEFSISYLQDNLSLKFQEKEKTNKLFYKNIWSACSGIDYSSYRLYMNGEITDISLIENLQLIINEKKYGMHRFRPIISDHSGNFNSFIFSYNLEYFDAIDEVEVEDIIPAEFSLSPAYPNPFNPTTMIQYSLPKNSQVLLSVYDSQGNLVENIVNEQKEIGYHQINWNASGLPSGVYFYKLVTLDFVDVKKCLLVK